MRLPRLLPAVLVLALGAACLAIYGFAGARIDTDGFLREPFYLLPMGAACLVLGTVLLAVALIRAGGGDPRPSDAELGRS